MFQKFDSSYSRFIFFNTTLHFTPFHFINKTKKVCITNKNYICSISKHDLAFFFLFQKCIIKNIKAVCDVNILYFLYVIHLLFTIATILLQTAKKKIHKDFKYRIF